MPVLSPQQAYSLFEMIIGGYDFEHFLVHYLPLAAEEIFRSPSTFKEHEAFKETLFKFRDVLNDSLKITIGDKPELEGQFISNYYIYFLNLIAKLNSKKEVKHKAKFSLITSSSAGEEGEEVTNMTNSYLSVYTDKQAGFSFSIVIDESNRPYSYAVLTLDCQRDNSKIDFKLELASIILRACGFKLVLNAKLGSDSILGHNTKLDKKTEKLINSLTGKGFFIENHIFNHSKSEISKVLSENVFLLNDFFGFFYFYSYAENDCIDKPLEMYNFIRSQLLCFKFEDSLDSTSTVIKRCKAYDYILYNGFGRHIKVYLCNVPLYSKKDIEKDFTPAMISGLKEVYIKADDFENCNGDRIKVQFVDDINCFMYVDFDDIHKLSVDLFVIDPLYLVKTGKEKIEEVKFLENKIDKNQSMLTKIIFAKIPSLQLFLNEKLINAIGSIYTYKKTKDNIGIKLHTNQIFTVLMAANCYKNLANERHKINGKKGCVFQVETGEGKSLIIQAVAALIALSGKTVHIATSNIILALRDYEDSIDFFKANNLRSGVLLHQNEIPSKNKKRRKKNLNHNGHSHRHQKRKNLEKRDFDKYPDIFYSSESFKNPTNLNIGVCKSSNGCNIVFSTFFNFEGYYLRQMTENPIELKSFTENNCLIIDEADTILIDELTNGTIISRAMNSNGIEILTKIYEKYLKSQAKVLYDELSEDTSFDPLQDESYKNSYTDLKDEIIKMIKEEYKSCTDLINDDKKIDDMIADIQIVRSKDFINGKRYTFGKGRHKSKIIIPFDSENKGMPEPNKEFGGYIHQFIAIKEILENKIDKMEIKPISINYLFVSHPSFVSSYYGVIGFTGTVGNEQDQNLLLENYHLDTFNIPRHRKNLRVELPTKICMSADERDDAIIKEIIEYNKRKNPVLVVFQDLIEIIEIKKKILEKKEKILRQKEKNEINFDVHEFKGEKGEENVEKIAGKDGSVSFGTNLCGRGTNIENNGEPLHVIVAYSSHNNRAMYQAFGRTARQGKKGTTRVICTLDKYTMPKEMINTSSLDTILDDLKGKKQFQFDFIEKYRKEREWMFNGRVDSQKLTRENFKTIRDSAINVNRYSACNITFPLGLSVETFLKIQSQKIYSLVNCPNCSKTWILFQRYMRELLLEAWSLFLDKTDADFYRVPLSERGRYKDFFNNNKSSFEILLNEYLPSNNHACTTMINTFMNIHGIVTKEWQELIMNNIPEELRDFQKKTDGEKFFSIRCGFFPYSFSLDPNARKTNNDGDDDKITYIRDPEIMYLDNKNNHISITYIIDEIFEFIAKKIDETISKYTGLNFFLRRTIAGCEFGICCSLVTGEAKSDKLGEHCICDTETVILLTVSVKSMMPILAGILICLAIFVAGLGSYLTALMAKKGVNTVLMTILKKGKDYILEKVKDTIQNKIEDFVKIPIEKFFDSASDFLTNKIEIELQDNGNDAFSTVIRTLMQIAGKIELENTEENLQEMLSVKISPKLDNFKGLIPIANLLKLAFLIIAYISAFIVKFNYKRQLTYFNSTAEDFEKDAEKRKNKNTPLDRSDVLSGFEKQNNIQSTYFLDEMAGIKQEKDLFKPSIFNEDK